VGHQPAAIGQILWIEQPLSKAPIQRAQAFDLRERARDSLLDRRPARSSRSCSTTSPTERLGPRSGTSWSAPSAGRITSSSPAAPMGTIRAMVSPRRTAWRCSLRWALSSAVPAEVMTTWWSDMSTTSTTRRARSRDRSRLLSPTKTRGRRDLPRPRGSPNNKRLKRRVDLPTSVRAHLRTEHARVAQRSTPTGTAPQSSTGRCRGACRPRRAPRSQSPARTGPPDSSRLERRPRPGLTSQDGARRRVLQANPVTGTWW